MKFVVNILICVHIVLMWTVNSNGSPVTQYMVYPRSESVCSTNQFRCSNGACLHESLLCNGKPDCPLGDDEQSCPSKSSQLVSSSSTIKKANSSFSDDCAPSKFYHCQESKKCIPWSQLCDGKIQCLLADDENQVNCDSVPGFNSPQNQVQQPEQQPQQLQSLPQQSEQLKQQPQLVDKVLSSKATSNTFSYGQWTSPSPPTSSNGYSSWSYVSSSTVDYTNYANNYGSNNNNTNENGTQPESGAISVKTTKAVQSGDQSENNFFQNQDEPGFVFVNFGPIISGDKNVNGNGNDIGNGNGNGNENKNQDKLVPLRPIVPNDRGYNYDYSGDRSY